MNVYVLANIKDGGAIRGVYIKQQSAWNVLGTMPRNSGYEVYELPLNVSQLSTKYQELILTIIAIGETQSSTPKASEENGV